MDEQTRRELDHVARRLDGVEAVTTQFGAATMQVDELARDVVQIKAGIEALHGRISKRDREDAERREEALKTEIAKRDQATLERKKDRWLTIGTVLTATSIVIGAVALLLQAGTP